MEKEKCTRCDKPATTQTEQGKGNEKLGGLPVNNGYYCSKCYQEGLDIENEAMYGECLYDCKC